MRITAHRPEPCSDATLTAHGATAPARSTPLARGVIDRGLQRYVDSGRVPGIVALVMQDGKVVYEKAFGWADEKPTGG